MSTPVETTPVEEIAQAGRPCPASHRGGPVETLSTSAARTFSVRQQGLLSAAVRVVARSGLRGLTHRAVDREAGLPEGSCSAYMRTRLALLTRLTEYVISQFARDVE